MVEPSKSVVGPDVAEGVVALFARATSQAAGHATLQRLAELALTTTATRGTLVLERCRGGARVVAAAGDFDWLQGRLVSDDLFPSSLWNDDDLIQDFAVAALEDDDIRPRLVRCGVGGIVSATSVVDDRLVGCLVLGYADHCPPLSSPERVAIGLLSICVTEVYSRNGSRGAVCVDCGNESRTISDDDHNLFIAVTSHELRTPVTVIRGYSDTLAERWDQLDDPARRSAVSVIRQRSRDLGRLLDRMLSASGDGMGPATLADGVPFDALDALRHAVQELPTDLRRDVSLQLPNYLPKAFGDRGTIATIMTELVTNACKYSEGKPEVEVTVGADAVAVWLRVSDRGIGIHPEHVERAFDRFWQSESGGRRGRGGVGLGLYLVRKVVERHQGWVCLRPRDGGGTVAEVRLPRADAASRKV